MRAQTTLDFAIGMSIFLITVAFVLSFSTGITKPFADSDQDHTVIADRVADAVSGGLLGDPETASVVDDDCTVAFFGGPDPGYCNFDPSNSLGERVGTVGIPAGTEPELNVTFEGNLTNDADGADPLCWDDAKDLVVEEDNSACTSTLVFKTGSDPPQARGSVVVARRLVSINGKDATILVRVWS